MCENSFLVDHNADKNDHSPEILAEILGTSTKSAVSEPRESVQDILNSSTKSLPIQNGKSVDFSSHAKPPLYVDPYAEKPLVARRNSKRISESNLE